MNSYFEGYATEGFFETSDHVRLHYIEAGKENEKTLIALPGWSGTADYLMFNLKALASEYHVYILEHRGHGESEVPAKGYRIARLAADAREFFLSLHISKAHWLGHSMGCSVLWSYFDLFGDSDFEKWVLVDEAPCLMIYPKDTPEEIEVYGGLNDSILETYNFVRGKGSDQPPFDVPSGISYENETNQALYEQYRVPLDHSRDRELYLARLIVDHFFNDWRDVIPQITVPTLYISGDVGHATNEKCCKWIVDHIPGSKWVRFSAEEYGTHMMMINSPEKFNREVLSFLKD